MKFLVVLCLVGLTLADHGHHASTRVETRSESSGYAGYGPAVRTPEPSYGAPVVPAIRTPEASYGAPVVPAIRTPEPSYGAPVVPTRAVVVEAPEPTYAAPVVRAPQPSYNAPVAYNAPVQVIERVEPTYVAPVKVEPTYAAPAPVVVAKVETPAPAYEAPGYGYAKTQSYRTEEVRTPSQQVAYDLAWSAPAYQRLAYAKTAGYAAASSGYEAPAAGYDAPKSGYEASSNYGAPLRNVAEEKSAETNYRYAPTEGTQSRAYIKFEQNVGGSYGTRTIGEDGEVVNESYSSDSAPSYRYAYGVEDPLSGDIKQAEEERSGINSRGSYSFLQPDGCTRTVRYTTDEWGFKAVVEYRGAGCAERYDV